MRFRDVGRYLLVLLVLLVVDLLTTLAGLRDPKPGDYDRACVIAAISVVLWAIREERDRTEAEKIADGLSEERRAAILSFRAEPRQMGIGMTHWLAGLVEAEGINHPTFGPHHRLTPLGLEVLKILEGRIIASPLSASKSSRFWRAAPMTDATASTLLDTRPCISGGQP